MGRSLKKGPFCDEHLMKKIEKLNETGQKQGI
jgi:small subunit ribosomal protein S19